MKKSKKTVFWSAVTTTSAIAGVASVLAPATKQDKDNVKVVNKKTNSLNATTASNEVLFGDKTFTSIEDATNDFLSKNGVVSQKLFLGDINAATSSNDYNSVDLTKLKEVNSNNVSKAYKMLTDKYTDDISEAKRSYLQNPVIKWSDRNGNLYDSEWEAKRAMEENGKAFTNPIGYYEVKDFSRLDQYRNPTVVKINPLNTTDQQALKEIAARNMLDDKSNFNLERLSVDSYKNENVYNVTSSFEGKDNNFINNLTKQVATEVAKVIRENSLLNVKVRALADVPKKEMWYRQNGKAHAEIVNFSFNTNGWNSKAAIFPDEIRNDGQYFSTKDGKWGQKFELKVGGYSERNYTPIYDYAIKNGQKVLGGQSLSFTLNNGSTIGKKYKNYMNAEPFNQFTLHSNDISFMGKGKKVNGYFLFDINQQGFDESFFNNQTNRSKLDARSGNVRNSVNDLLNKTFSEWGFAGDESRALAKDIADASSQLIYQNVMGKDVVSSPTLANASQLNNTLDRINEKIVNKLDEKLRNSQKLSLTDTISKYLTLKYQSRDTNNSTNDIYVVTYNNAPLFKLDQSLVSNLFNDPFFKTNPLEAIKRNFRDKLSSNYLGFIDTLKNGMTNISNSYKYNKQNNKLELTKQAIDKYNSNQKEANFKFDDSSSNANFEGVKLFNNNIFAENNLNDSHLEKELNRREEDDKSLLNNQYGTFEAVYQYNKTLSELMSQEHATDALKANVKKNAINNVNDVVVLYEKNNSPATIKYGEYLNYGYKFNESLSNNNGVRIISSDEKRKYEISQENLNIPTKQYTYFDYNGKVLLTEVVEAINGNYEMGAQQVYLNALNKISVPASNEYIYYTNLDGKKELVKNQTTKLNVLKIESNGQTYQYGFTKYADLYNYATEYIKLNVSNNEQGGGSLFNRSNVPAIVSGFQAAFGIVILAEVIVMSYIFVKNNKNFKLSQNKQYNWNK